MIVDIYYKKTRTVRSISPPRTCRSQNFSTFNSFPPPFRKWEEKIGKTSWSSLLGWNARTLQPRGTNANGKRHVPGCLQPAVQMSLVMCTPYVWKRCTQPDPSFLVRMKDDTNSGFPRSRPKMTNQQTCVSAFRIQNSRCGCHLT